MRQSMLAYLVLGVHSALSAPVQSDLSKGILNFVTRSRSSLGLTRRQSNGSSISDVHDTLYLADITLGGVKIQALIDTGSSDLYVTPPISVGKSTGVIGSTAFGDGTTINGPIEVAELEFAGFTIPQQAFIQSDPSQDPVEQGLIGLGPDRNAVISKTLASENVKPNVLGNSPLANILNDNPDMSPILTLTLGRADSGHFHDSLPGTITVGQVLPDFEAINDQPKLDIFVDPTSETDVTEWKVQLDKDGFKVNGKSVPLPPSNVSSDSRDQLVVLLDAGSASPHVPFAVTEAIYGSVPGSSFLEEKGKWQVPCDAEFNVSWTFGGKDIPMHPLDMTRFDPTDTSNKTCTGAWLPAGPEVLDSVDLIFGTGFLRGVYTLINMGNAVGSANPNFDPDAKAFIQLLGIADPAKAHEEFLTARVPATVSSTSSTSSPASTPGTGSSAAKNSARSILRHGKLGVSVLTLVIGSSLALA